MHVALACSGRRGLRFFKKLRELIPSDHLTVFSFKEEPHEPPFLDDIRRQAEEFGATFVETRKLTGPKSQTIWNHSPIDILFLVGWRYLIDRATFQLPKLGTYVFHDSLLPRYRGFSPSVWAILNGEDHTGVTLFAIEDEVDSGNIVAQIRIPIGPDEYVGSVVEKVTEGYLQILEQHLPELLQGTAKTFPQDHSQSSYFGKRKLADNGILWSQPSEKIFNLIRAVSRPYPGAFTTWENQPIKIWSACGVIEPEGQFRIPGEILEIDSNLKAKVATGKGTILLDEIQLACGATLKAGQVLSVGIHLGV
jgi:methionyl-tRNA formyltransferase